MREILSGICSSAVLTLGRQHGLSCVAAGPIASLCSSSQWELLTVSCCFLAGASFWGSLGSMCRKEVDETSYPPSADFSISDKSVQAGILSIAYSQG